MAWVAWLTGLPGSGKTRVARETAGRLKAIGIQARVLELDEIRKVVTPSPRYTAEERETVYRALAYMALLLYEVGVNVIIDATGHRRRFRDLARAMIPHFAEVHLRASLARCRERAAERPGGFAPRDVYAQAGREGSTVPGVDEMYEGPLHPELVLDTERLTAAEAAERLVEFLKEFPGERRELSLGLDRRDRRSGEERR